MCGFIVAISDQPFSGDRLSKAETHLLHRGPDYTGSYSCRLKDGRYVNALHTRLTIVDDFWCFVLSGRRRMQPYGP